MFLHTVTLVHSFPYKLCRIHLLPGGGIFNKEKSYFQVLELVLVCDRHAFYTKYKAIHFHFVTKLDVQNLVWQGI
jgi:hypothetical protein